MSSLLCALALRLYCDCVRSGKYGCITWSLFFRILSNSASSALSNRSVIAGTSWLQYPNLWHRRKNAFVGFLHCVFTLFILFLQFIHCVSKNVPTLASCSFSKHGLNSISILSKMIYIFNFLYPFTFTNLFAFNGKDAKQCFYRRLLVALKRAGFSVVDFQSDVMSFRLHASTKPLSPLTNNCVDDVLWYTGASMRFCFKSPVSQMTHLYEVFLNGSWKCSAMTSEQCRCQACSVC